MLIGHLPALYSFIDSRRIRGVPIREINIARFPPHKVPCVALRAVALPPTVNCALRSASQKMLLGERGSAFGAKICRQHSGPLL